MRPVLGLAAVAFVAALLLGSVCPATEPRSGSSSAIRSLVAPALRQSSATPIPAGGELAGNSAGGDLVPHRPSGAVAGRAVQPGFRSSTLVAVANASPTTGYAPLRVSFSGSASGGTAPYYYSWQFVGYAVGGQFTNQTFTDATDYPVTLYVSDSASNFAQTNLTIVVLARPFSVNPLASPSSGDAPLNVDFSANPTGGATPYSWDWYVNGSPYPVLAENFSQTFTSPGVYPVFLLAFASGGQQRSEGWANVSVGTDRPVAAHISVSPAWGLAPLRVTVQGSAVDGLPPYNFSWSFGDGSRAFGAEAVHEYEHTGDYVLTLQVTDAAAHVQAATQVVMVTDILRALAQAAPAVAEIGAQVQYNGSATGGIPPYTYAWNFGDGTRGSGPAPTHAYNASGNFTVGLCVNDSVQEIACSAQHVAVHASTAASSSAFDLGGTPGYAILGGAVLVVAAASALAVWRRRKPQQPIDPETLTP